MVLVSYGEYDTTSSESSVRRKRHFEFHQLPGRLAVGSCGRESLDRGSCSSELEARLVQGTVPLAHLDDYVPSFERLKQTHGDGNVAPSLKYYERTVCSPFAAKMPPVALRRHGSDTEIRSRGFQFRVRQVAIPSNRIRMIGPVYFPAQSSDHQR